MPRAPFRLSPNGIGSGRSPNRPPRWPPISSPFPADEGPPTGRSAPATLELLDWRRRVFALYEEIRSSEDPEGAWLRWRAGRDDLFAGHRQSPIPEAERGGFPGVPYFDYDPTYRVLGAVREVRPEHFDVATSGDGAYGFTRFAVAAFELHGRDLELGLYWLDGYAGGLFLPFRDATSGMETYGAGRYLLDTVKGADLGTQGDRLVIDFNFAYNPSCAYDPRWVCPLAPPENRMAVEVRAGERSPDH